MLMPKSSRLVVLDSANFQQKSYQISLMLYRGKGSLPYLKFLYIIYELIVTSWYSNRAYKWYVMKGRIHDTDRPDAMTVRTHFPILTQLLILVFHY